MSYIPGSFLRLFAGSFDDQELTAFKEPPIATSSTFSEGKILARHKGGSLRCLICPAKTPRECSESGASLIIF